MKCHEYVEPECVVQDVISNENIIKARLYRGDRGTY